MKTVMNTDVQYKRKSIILLIFFLLYSKVVYINRLTWMNFFKKLSKNPFMIIIKSKKYATLLLLNYFQFKRFNYTSGNTFTASYVKSANVHSNITSPIHTCVCRQLNFSLRTIHTESIKVR